MFTKEQVARAALEAGVGVEKIKEMLKLLPEDTRNFTVATTKVGWDMRVYPVNEQ